jgi:ubiquitin-like domain-containing CTD phosphatase 1
MNPQNGLRIRPFREAHLNRDKDRELIHLSKYLKDISSLPDLSGLNHRTWEKYRPPRK